MTLILSYSLILGNIRFNISLTIFSRFLAIIAVTEGPHFHANGGGTADPGEAEVGFFLSVRLSVSEAPTARSQV